MKWLKRLGPVIVVLLVIPALLPDHFEVKRSIAIKGSQADVYSYLVNLQSWPEWSPWLAEDPSAEARFDGVPGVVGSFHEWKGKKIGSGRQTLIQIREPEFMEFDLKFQEPASPPATSSMLVNPQNDGVLVTWGMKGSLSYPVERVLGLMIPGMIGGKFEEGLKNMKKQLEAPPFPDPYEPKVIENPE